jgi:Heterokaryon incompatibility protein (HET)
VAHHHVPCYAPGAFSMRPSLYRTLWPRAVNPPSLSHYYHRSMLQRASKLVYGLLRFSCQPGHLPVTYRMPRFIYDYLPAGYVRLLEQVDGENISGHAEFRMRTYHMDVAPKFNALSYVWGSSSNPPMRLVSFVSESTPEGAPISISANLYEALPIVTAFSKRPLWIDALYINQEDDEEKGRVVSRMGELYGKAEEVIIWLGPHRDGSIFAMDVLSWLLFPGRRQQCVSASVYSSSHHNA